MVLRDKGSGLNPETRHTTRNNSKTCKSVKNVRRPWQEESVFSVTQSCPTLCDPMDCSLPGSSVHGIFQARILEWVAIYSSRGSSRPRDRTRIS